MIAFYLDENVPGAITKGLRDRGVNVLTAQEDGREGDEDLRLLERATQLNRVVVTMDRDFFVLTTRWRATGHPFSGVMLAPETMSYRQRIDDLEMVAKCSEPEDWADRLAVLPLVR